MYSPGCVALMPQSRNQHDVHRNPDDIRLHFFPPLSNMLGSQFKKFYYGCNIMLFKEAAFSRMKAVIQHLDRVKSVNPAGPGNTTCWAAATSCWGHQAAPPQPPGCSVAWGQSSTKVLW